MTNLSSKELCQECVGQRGRVGDVDKGELAVVFDDDVLFSALALETDHHGQNHAAPPVGRVTDAHFLRLTAVQCRQSKLYRAHPAIIQDRVRS